MMNLRKYGFDIEKYKLNRSVRKFYTKKMCENDKKKNIEIYEEIFSFITDKPVDKDRFYYIYFEMGECLFRDGRYGKASKYFKTAIDNVITESYKKNKSKLKLKHYDLFLKDYDMAIECFLKSGQFDDADYYINLNMYCKSSYNLPSESMGDFYASRGAKNLAIKYYDKRICEINDWNIIRLRDYDPYRDGYLKEEYEEELKQQKKEIDKVFEKIKSL